MKNSNNNQTAAITVDEFLGAYVSDAVHNEFVPEKYVVLSIKRDGQIDIINSSNEEYYDPSYSDMSGSKEIITAKRNKSEECGYEYSSYKNLMQIEDWIATNPAITKDKRAKYIEYIKEIGYDVDAVIVHEIWMNNYNKGHVIAYDGYTIYALTISNVGTPDAQVNLERHEEIDEQNAIDLCNIMYRLILA